MSFSSIVERILRKLGIVSQPVQHQTAATWQTPTPPQAQPIATQQAPAPTMPPAQQVAATVRLPYTHNGMERRYQYQNVDVFMPQPQVLDMPGLDVGAEVGLWQDTANQYDSKAVAVVFGGYIIGYLYRGKLQDMANDWMSKGKPTLAMVCEKAPEALRICLAFYDLPKLERLMQGDPNPTAYKLTRTGSKAAQEALDLCTEGDELDICEDDEGRLYVANYNDDVVGYLPAKAVEAVENYGGPERCSVFLAATDMDSNLKTTASVYIFRGK